MEKIHKTLVLVTAVIAASVLLHCQAQQFSITQTEWKLVSLPGETIDQSNPPTLTFDEATKKISGFGGCNRFFGGYESTENRIKFSALGSTKMFCQDKMSLEDNYFKALQEADSFRVEGSTLQLIVANRVILEFKK